MNTLLIQDTFEPYYAGRPGYSAPDAAKRRKADDRCETDRARRDEDTAEKRPKPGTPEH